MSERENLAEMITEYMEMMTEFCPLKQEVFDVEKNFANFKKEIEKFEKDYEDLHKELEQIILPEYNVSKEKIKLLLETDAKYKAIIDSAKTVFAELYEKFLQYKDKINQMEVKLKIMEKYLFPQGRLIPQ